MYFGIGETYRVQIAYSFLKTAGISYIYYVVCLLIWKFRTHRNCSGCCRKLAVNLQKKWINFGKRSFQVTWNCYWELCTLVHEYVMLNSDNDLWPAEFLSTLSQPQTYVFDVENQSKCAQFKMIYTGYFRN